MTPAERDNLAAVIAKDWYRQACREPYGKFFLWHRPAREGEKVAIPIVSLDAPNEAYIRDIQISNAWPVHVAARKIAERLSVLPILARGVGANNAG